jgi:hypothetical protein
MVVHMALLERRAAAPGGFAGWRHRGPPVRDADRRGRDRDPTLVDDAQLWPAIHGSSPGVLVPMRRRQAISARPYMSSVSLIAAIVGVTLSLPATVTR